MPSQHNNLLSWVRSRNLVLTCNTDIRSYSAFCRLAEPIAFTSILAYSFVMVKELNGTDRDASVYSGLLVSAFAIAETSTIMFWGALSDRIGRKPVVLMGLAGTALSSMIFGFAQKYWVALLARLLGGSLNGNLAVLQTMVSEMVKRPEHERKRFHTLGAGRARNG